MDQKDQIESWFEDHRDAFDTTRAPEMWSEIERRLPAQPARRMVPLAAVLRVAAVVAVLLSAGLFYFLRETPVKKPVAREIPDQKRQEILYAHYPELAEAAFWYQGQIAEAESELARYPVDTANLQSVHLLEEEMNALKAEMGDQVDNERLVKAMIQIYQYKLDMLNNMLRHIRSTEKKEDEENNVVPI